MEEEGDDDEDDGEGSDYDSDGSYEDRRGKGRRASSGKRIVGRGKKKMEKIIPPVEKVCFHYFCSFVNYLSMRH